MNSRHLFNFLFTWLGRLLSSSLLGQALITIAALAIVLLVPRSTGQAASLSSALVANPMAEQSEITMVPGTVTVEEIVENAIRDALVQGRDSMPVVTDRYAISAVRDEGTWLFVSVVGLANLDADLRWNLQDNARWYGLVLLHQGGNGLWTGAVEGTRAYSRLLANVPETILTAEAKRDLDPHQHSAMARASSYAFPWQGGTSMQYGSLGVHDNGFISGWKAVDFISDGNTGQGHAPNRLLAAASGTISYVCNDGTSVAIRIGDLMYTHLLHNGNLYTGRYFNQCDELGQLKPGSFSNTCGYANQSSGSFHVHWGFPDTGSFQAEGWTLSFSDQKWHKAGETRQIYDWFQAGTCGCSDVAAVGENSSRQQQFVDAYSRNGGKTNLGCTENAAHWWGPAVAQDFTGNPNTYGDSIILHDEPNDIPQGTIPAYVVHGGIWNTYLGMGGPGSYLGAPTSDEFTNAAGKPQSNFANGYLVWDGGGHDYPWPTSFSQWKTQYYNNTELVGYPTMVRNESFPDHDWGSGAPAAGEIGVFADKFSVRWTRTLDFTGGYYRFSTSSDDGVRVWVDGTRIINSWVSGGSQSHSHVMQLTGGNHTVKIEYFEDSGPAYFDIGWTRDTTPPTKASNLRPNGWSGPYTNDSTPSFKWTAATDDLSGMAGYYIAINDWTPEGGFGNDWAIGNVTFWTLADADALADGSHFVALTARDNAGLTNPTNTNTQGDAPYYEFIVDTTPPTGATNLTVNGLSAHGDGDGDGSADGNFINDDTPTFQWTPGQDATSGIDKQWGSFSDWAPEYNDIALGDESVVSYTVPHGQSLDDGPHFFAIGTGDKAGNRDVPNANTHAAAAPHIHFYVDTVPPSSTVSALPATTIGQTFTVTWSGGDVGSGIASYDVQVRDGINGRWQDWLVNTDGVSAIFTGQMDHTYYFRCRANDQAGNGEAWPFGDGDAHIYVEIHRVYLPTMLK